METTEFDRIEVKAELRELKNMYVMRFRWFVPGNPIRQEKMFSTHLAAKKENKIKAEQRMWDKRKEFEEEVNIDYFPCKRENTEFTMFIQRWIRQLEKT